MYHQVLTMENGALQVRKEEKTKDMRKALIETEMSQEHRMSLNSDGMNAHQLAIAQQNPVSPMTRLAADGPTHDTRQHKRRPD